MVRGVVVHIMYTGEKSVQCKQRDKRFSLVGTLNMHETRHTGEKNAVCCVSWFGSLPSYKLIHTE